MRTKPEGSYISYFSNLVKSNGGINLAQGIPGFQPPKKLIDILNDVSSTEVHQYAPGIGNLKLRALVEQYYGVSPDQLLMVQGATEGLSLVYTYLLKILGSDFGVLSFNPAYESYSQLPKIFGQQFVEFYLDENNSIDFDELGKTVERNRVKLIFISSPGNPYGKIWSRDEIDNILNLAEKHGVFIVFDSVYEELYFEYKPYIPIDRLNERLFIVSSFSKSLCITGWRIGYIIHHSTHCKGLRAVHDYIGLCAPSVLQEALALYLSQNGYGRDFMVSFRENVKLSFNELGKALIELGFHVPKIDGGCFVWAELPPKFDDGFEFASELYEQKRVAVIPGEHFSKSSTKWIRFNVARPVDEIRLAVTSLKEFFRE